MARNALRRPVGGRRAETKKELIAELEAQRREKLISDTVRFWALYQGIIQEITCIIP
jgi:hypothetical protein